MFIMEVGVLLLVTFLTKASYLSAGLVQQRIVGGHPAKLGSTPYQVSLRDFRHLHFCGGAIVNERWIITAAHCLTKAFLVVVGTDKLDEGGDRYTVETVLRQTFDPKTMKHDLGLVKVTRPIKFGANVQPVRLRETEVKPKERARVTGWGRFDLTKPVMNELQELETLTISYVDCMLAWLYMGEIFESQVCTFTRGGEGTCFGDSGGPLVVNNELTGVVSWGYPCAIGMPDIYTSVYSYLDWIKKNTKV